jgi:replicative DNA helicase
MSDDRTCDVQTFAGSFKNGESIVIGARPSRGKTTLGLKIVSSLIANRHIKAAFISLEMSNHFLQKLLQKYNCDIDAGSLIISDTPHISLSELLIMIKSLTTNENASVFCIDYLGLVQEVGDSNIHRELKNLATELNIVIISLSQLSRTAEQEKPELKHLRPDADNVGKYADKVYLLGGSKVQEGKIMSVDVIEAKNGKDFPGSTFVLKLS